MKLPNVDRSVIDTAKIRGYLLSRSHPVGRFKAAFFTSLGYTDEDWQQLEADLRGHARTHEASAGESTGYGQKYDVRGILTGPLVRRGASVITVWIVRTGEDFPRFITAYPG